MSETRTPGPWTLGGQRIVGSDDIHSNGRERNRKGISSASYSSVVCEMHGDLRLPSPRANAEFIVRACNSHEDLLAACEAVEAQLLADAEGHCPGWIERMQPLYGQVSAAITKAKGE